MYIVNRLSRQNSRMAGPICLIFILKYLWKLRKSLNGTKINNKSRKILLLKMFVAVTNLMSFVKTKCHLVVKYLEVRSESCFVYIFPKYT